MTILSAVSRRAVTRTAALVALCAGCALSATARAQNAKRNGEEASQRAIEAFAAGDFATARDQLHAALKNDPANPALLYNLACVHAQLGETDQAQERLLDAISAGFVDFFQLERDDSLAPIRKTTTYQAIIAGWRRLLDARNDAELAAMRRHYGGRYRYEKDEALRLSFVSAFDPTTFEETRSEMRVIAAWAKKTLFTDVSTSQAQDDDRPDPWTLVLLPTPEDFVLAVGAPDIGGWYDHDRRRLIAQDLGPSLRHEFLHVLHWRHMTRLGQRHPEWIMEGLGSLVEDITIDGASGLTPALSQRTNIAIRLAKAHRLMPIQRFASMEHKRFVTVRPLAHYAQARSLMLFLNERDLLGAWYARYVQSFADDPTGVKALEDVLGKPAAAIDREFRAWLIALPEVAQEIRPGMASLGVELSLGRGDGPRVARMKPGSPVRKAGLRLGDVVVAIDGVTTRTMDDVVRFLGDHKVGDMVTARIRRGRRFLSVTLTLAAQPPDAGG